MKVALLHDWTIHMRGGEKVLDALAEIYPDAAVYTLFYDKRFLSPSLRRMKFKASFLQWLPGIKKYYRWLLPLLPLVVKSMKIEDADLVISSSHCVIKGANVPPRAFHICYCHTPMRYIWGFEGDYFGKFPKSLKPLLDWILANLRSWDKESNRSIHRFVANSHFVEKRIERFYGRPAEVIYPPLDSFYTPQENPVETGATSSRERAETTKFQRAEGYYLVVSAFVPYKKVDIVIEAFNRLARPLLVVGKGPKESDYRKLRKSEKISFLGSVSDTELRNLYSGARALIFPTEEDFGIVPLEAQACGAPVIAYGKGGALESVKQGQFFYEQTPEAVEKAVIEFESRPVDRAKIPALVESFKKESFKKNFREFAEKAVKEGTDVAP